MNRKKNKKIFFSKNQYIIIKKEDLFKEKNLKK